MRELCLGKRSKPHLAEFCENGGKATAWELTGKRMPAKFFEQHTLTELETWSDHELEVDGRLTVPMRCDATPSRIATLKSIENMPMPTSAPISTPPSITRE